jgi:hypothetical protein
MKHHNLINFNIVMFSCATIIAGSNAEQLIQDPGQIRGTWMLEGTSMRIDSKKNPENSKWEFRDDGKLIVSGYNKIIKAQTTVEDAYEISDGNILTGKGHKYIPVEKQESKMILKGPYGYYHFAKE